MIKISSSLIRNPNISPQCKWLISYLMTFPCDYNISIPEVIKSQKISKNRIYPIINEAIEKGHLIREEYLDQGKKRYSYKLRTQKEDLNVSST